MSSIRMIYTELEITALTRFMSQYAPMRLTIIRAKRTIEKLNSNSWSVEQTAPLHPPKPSLETAFFRLCVDTFHIFQSVQLAIVLISSLVVGIMLGVFMPQEGMVELQQIKTQFGQWYWPLKALGMFNVYSSYWFLTLEILFFFNLLAGSFRWLKPAIIAATAKATLPVVAIQKAKPSWQWQWSGSPEAIDAVLRQRKYQRINHVDNSSYWTKGSWTRFGPAVAHIGILSMLMASVFGAFTGFKAQKAAVPGETFSIPQADNFTTGVPVQFWQGKPPNWKLRVKDFRVDMYANKPDTVKQYYCTLDVLDNTGKFIKTQVISVNYPLQMGDVMVYQASFAPTGKLFLSVNGKPVSVKASEQMQDRPVAWVPIPNSNRTLMIFPFFIQQDPGVKQNYLVAMLRENNRFVGQRPGKMPDNLRLKAGEAGTLAGVTLTYHKPELMTGLQIKSAPETAWIYLSFLVICLGTVMCFFSQRRLWVGLTTDGHQPNGQWVLSILPKTNKGKIGFRQEMAQLDAAFQAQQAVLLKTGGPLQ
jgi:cytochrome c biogenesis protein